MESRETRWWVLRKVAGAQSLDYNNNALKSVPQLVSSDPLCSHPQGGFTMSLGYFSLLIAARIGAVGAQGLDSKLPTTQSLARQDEDFLGYDT